MLQFRPMSDVEFLEFRRRALHEYAAERVAAGDWLPEDAPGKADHAFSALLPVGRSSPGHRLTSLVEAATDKVIGSVWWQERPRAGRRSAHLLDLFIEPSRRRRGLGHCAMNLLEATLHEEGIEGLTLNVFGRNHLAIQLYRDLGYEVVTLEMAKTLGATQPRR